MKHITIYFLLASIVLGCKGKPEPKKTDNRPNIIVILCDDLGYSDVGFNGSTDIPTPRLDQLAHNGTILTSGYVVHPFCGPSRAGLLTGRYPHTFGSQFNLPRTNKNMGKGIPLEETFMSKILQDAGYFTGAVGKWHLGTVEQFHPNNRGFDDFYGFLGGGHKYFPEQYRAAYDKQKQQGVEDIWEYLTPLEHNGKDVLDSDQYLTDELSLSASNFIEAASQKDNPFFLFLAYNAPHVPLEATAEDLAKFAHIEDVKRRTYAAMVHAVDRGVGKVVEALKKTDEFENTLIVFLSDNGGKLSEGATNHPFREGKGSTCEGGIRVPMFFHWPNNIPAGQTYEHPVTALDFYPTFAFLAGAEIPKDKKLDGKNIWEHLTSNTDPRNGQMIYALRHRPGYTDVGGRKDQWKILKTDQNTWKIFDVDKDPGEEMDLSAQHPELLEEMVSNMEEWSKTHIQPLWFHDQETGQEWEKAQMPHFEQTFLLED